MIARVLRLLGIRRRASLKLSPGYETRRVRELRQARTKFEVVRD